MKIKNRKHLLKNDSIQAVLMLAPMMFGFILFTYVPILYILRFAFYSTNGIQSTFTGVENFVRVLTRDFAYWTSVLNTVVLSAGKLLVEIPLALLLALLLNSRLRGIGFFRVTLFLPAVISASIAGLVFSLMFSTYNGVINQMLTAAGWIAKPVNWLGNKWTAMLMLGITSIWNNFGINMVFFLMALQSVPRELYECADIDGATPVKKLFKITIPMIGPTFQVVLLMAIVGSLRVSDLVLASTNGAPGNSTEVVMTYVFKYFFGYGGRRVQVGYASAMAIVTGIILAGISLVYMRASRRLNDI